MDMDPANFKIVLKDFEAPSIAYEKACETGETGKTAFEHPAFIISTADISIPGEEIIKGLMDKAGQEITIVGGGAGEPVNFSGTSLTYARFEREAPEPHFSSVRFAAWLNDEVDAVRLLGRDLAITVDTEKLPENLHVDLDRKAMPYALRNLLRNAFKYASKQVVVSAELDQDRILIHVDDDGIGIPPEDREHVFSAFTRLDRSRDRATGGYGLGLAITRRVLELHGGTATADAAPLGGARFTLSWKAQQ